MGDQEFLSIEINGHTATPDELRHLALHSYGHFTAMQVRAGRVRGLNLHLARLTGANREMFGVDLDGDLVREYIRHALCDGDSDASVRTIVYWVDADDAPSVLVTVRPPGGVQDTPHHMRSVPYQRPLPHLKQVGGGFGQVYYHRIAQRDGYTEILLTGQDGVISEGGITNVGFFDGSGVVWPDAPALAGITMQLLEPRLTDGGIASRRGTVRLADVHNFETVFVTNSRGIVPAGRLDGQELRMDTDFLKTVAEIYESVPWDRI